MRTPSQSCSAESDDDPFRSARAAIELHGAELASYPGVVSVRPGFRFRDGAITDEPAVSVSVLRKHDVKALRSCDLLPRRLGKVVVDVVPAGPEEQLRAAVTVQPDTTLPTAAKAVAELAAGGGVVDTRTLLEAEQEEQFSLQLMAPAEEYPEPERQLTEVDEEMKLVLHASPDTGWRLLKNFLERTQRTLTATMFEFTALHILDALISVLQTPKTFRFIMDFEKEEDSDLDNPRALRRLGEALGDRLTFAWAPVARDNVTTVGYFPSSYHIKVAVRDSEAVWLSSGNWKESGQPETDPFDPPAGFVGRSFQRRYNREWHVVAESKSLAEQFEYFIDHDLHLASTVQVAGLAEEAGPARPDLFVPADDFGPGPAAEAQFFRELTLSKRMRVQPLLTPRHFVEHVLPLLRNARKRVWFQNQSLNPKASDPEYTELFNALRDKSREADIDTRIIVRGDYGPSEILQRLRQSSFLMSRVRLQAGCHTKGLIIDDTAVIVGSHNWTGQGARENRDASLILYDLEAIEYYARLFEYDWQNLARFKQPEMVAMLAPAGAAAPAGMRRVAWTELFE